jgi:hypothetical protein
MSSLLISAAPMPGSSALGHAWPAPSMPSPAMSNRNNPAYAAQHATTRWLGTVDSMDLCTKSTGIFGAERVATGSLGEHLT